MSSPLRVYFYNELNRSTSGKPELCTVRFAGIFHEERSWSKSKSKFKFKFVHFKFISSCNLFTKQGDEEKCQRSKSSRKNPILPPRVSKASPVCRPRFILLPRKSCNCRIVKNPGKILSNCRKFFWMYVLLTYLKIQKNSVKKLCQNCQDSKIQCHRV